MLKKENRLSKVKRMAGEKFFKSLHFNLTTSENGESTTKFGFVVSKKVSKSAVVRNRTKRVMRSIIEEDMEKIALGKNIVFFSKKDINWDDRPEIKKEMEEIFNQAKIIK